MSALRLDLLNSWPEGTVGHAEDANVLIVLAEIGRLIGYGRLAQMADELRRLALDPDAVHAFEAQHAARMVLLAECARPVKP